MRNIYMYIPVERQIDYANKVFIFMGQIGAGLKKTIRMIDIDDQAVQ